MRSHRNLERDRQRNRGFSSGMVRAVWDPREGSKIQTFLFSARMVCSSLLHLRSVILDYFVMCASSEVLHRPGPMRQGFLFDIGDSKLYVHTFSAKLAPNSQNTAGTNKNIEKGAPSATSEQVVSDELQ